MEILLKIGFIVLFIAISFFIFYRWGMKPVIFKDKTINDLHLFLSILLFRGYTESKSFPDGRLYIKNSLSNRFVIIKKYKIKVNSIGEYIFFPLFNDTLKTKINEKLKKLVKNENIWEDYLYNIEMDVIGVDIGMDRHFGVEILKELIPVVFESKKEDLNFDLCLINVSDDTNLEDFDINTIDLSKFDSDLLMPVKKGVKAAVRFLDFIKKIIELMSISGKK